MSYDTDPKDVEGLTHALAQSREHVRAMKAERDDNIRRAEAVEADREYLNKTNSGLLDLANERQEQIAVLEAKLAEAERELRSMRTDCVAGAVFRIMEQECDRLRQKHAAAEADVKALRGAATELLARLDRNSTEGWGIWADNLRAALAASGGTKPVP